MPTRGRILYRAKYDTTDKTNYKGRVIFHYTKKLPSGKIRQWWIIYQGPDHTFTKLETAKKWVDGWEKRQYETDKHTP